MTCPVLVLGGQGLLGSRLMQAYRARGIPAASASRTDPNHMVDVTDVAALLALLDSLKPDVIINCVAEIDVAACEINPDHAYAVNAKPLETLAKWCGAQGAKLVQISTDQLFAGQGAQKHDEAAPIHCPHVYAASKYAGEQAAHAIDDHLIIRTNLTDVCTVHGKTPFARWAFDQAKTGIVTGFDDYYCSTIDTPTLAIAILDLIARGVRGTVHVGSSDVVSKADFIALLLDAAGLNAQIIRTSASGLKPARALSAGLDVRRAERLLGRSLPNSAQVVQTLAQMEKERHAL